MGKIATTVEQSKRLVVLGLDVGTADMHYTLDNTSGYELYAGSPGIRMVPAWSLDALVSIMPDEIEKAGFSEPFPFGMLKGHDKVWFQYFYGDGGALVQSDGSDSIDAAVGMVEWLLESGYLASTFDTDTNKERKMSYGLRIGDVVEYGEWKNAIVVRHMFMNNNGVWLMLASGRIIDAVAEHCRIVKKIEEK